MNFRNGDAQSITLLLEAVLLSMQTVAHFLPLAHYRRHLLLTVCYHPYFVCLTTLPPHFSLAPPPYTLAESERTLPSPLTFNLPVQAVNFCVRSFLEPESLVGFTVPKVSLDFSIGQTFTHDFAIEVWVFEKSRSSTGIFKAPIFYSGILPVLM